MLLSEDAIRAAVAAAFLQPKRVQTVLVRDWQLTVVISCDHTYGTVTVAELVKLAEGLSVPVEQVTVWDIPSKPNMLEISADCDSPTPIERPERAKTIK